MKNTVLAKRYAKALFSVAGEEGASAGYARALNDMAQLYAAVPELGDALSNPLYPLEVREKVLEALLPSLGASRMMGNFFRLLVQKRRAVIIPDVAEVFQDMVDAENNTCQGTLISAMEIDAALNAKVKATLEKITGKQVLLTTKVDPSIIGGIIAKVGDLVLDGSIRTQLACLKESIKGSE